MLRSACCLAVLVLAGWCGWAGGLEDAWIAHQAWERQFCAHDCPDGAYCPHGGTGAVLYLTGGAPALQLLEWTGRAERYRQLLCGELQGRPADAAGASGCADAECLHALLAASLANVRLALANRSLSGLVVNASGPLADDPPAPPGPPEAAAGPRPPAAAATQAFVVPVALGARGAVRSSVQRVLGMPPALAAPLTAAAAAPRTPEEYRALRRRWYTQSGGRVLLLPLVPRPGAAGRWETPIGAPPYVAPPLYARLAEAGRALVDQLLPPPPPGPPPGGPQPPEPLRRLLRAVVGLHTSAGPAAGNATAAPGAGGGGPYAELNVVNVSQWARPAAGAGLVALEELCVAAPDGERRCLRSVVTYRFDAAAGALHVAKYAVPEAYAPGAPLRLAELTPRGDFQRCALVGHGRRWAALSVAAQPDAEGGLAVWRHEHEWRADGVWAVSLLQAPRVAPEALQRLALERDPQALERAAGAGARVLRLELRRRGDARDPVPPAQWRACGPPPPAAPADKRRAAVPQDNILDPRFVFDRCVFRAEDREAGLHCAFIHGAGREDGDFAIVQDRFEPYWGPIHEWTPRCRTRWFLAADTIMTGWESPELQQAVCRAVVGPRAGTLAHHTTVLAHSMGNLVLAAALLNGHCEWDRATNAWLSISGPWNAEAIPRLAEICEGRTLLDATVAYAANALGFCVGDKVSPGYASIDPDYPGMWRLLALAKKLVTAAMCGRSASGLAHWLYTPALPAISRLLDVENPSDGLVSVESCARVAPFNGTWGRHPMSKWYIGRLNHVDTTGRHGNTKSPEESPLMWVMYHHRPKD